MLGGIETATGGGQDHSSKASRIRGKADSMKAFCIFLMVYGAIALAGTIGMIIAMWKASSSDDDDGSSGEQEDQK